MGKLDKAGIDKPRPVGRPLTPWGVQLYLPPSPARPF